MQLDLEIYRGHTPVNTNFTIRDKDGSRWSENYTSNGKKTVEVPEKQRYTIVLTTYREKNEYPMGPQTGRHKVILDLDEMGTR